MADIRIKNLTPTSLPNLNHEFPAEKDDLTVKLKVGQILDLVTTNLLNNDPTFAAGVLDALSKRLRFDAAQTLTLAQQSQALANIGAIAAIPDFVRNLILSNNALDAANDIDISAGSAKGNGRFVVRSSALGKRLDANWAAGGTPAAAVGGLDTGAKANGATYTAFAIQKDSDGTGDVVFSLSPSAPTMTLLTGYTVVCPLGRVMVDGSGVNRPFIQSGNDFYFNTLLASLPTDLSITATRAKSLLTCTIPSGVRTLGYFHLTLVTATGDTTTIMTVADGSNANIEQLYELYVSTSVKRTNAVAPVYTNTSAQIYVGDSITPSSSAANIVKVLGWNDYTIPRI